MIRQSARLVFDRVSDPDPIGPQFWIRISDFRTEGSLWPYLSLSLSLTNSFTNSLTFFLFSYITQKKGYRIFFLQYLWNTAFHRIFVLRFKLYFIITVFALNISLKILYIMQTFLNVTFLSVRFSACKFIFLIFNIYIYFCLICQLFQSYGQFVLVLLGWEHRLIYGWDK